MKIQIRKGAFETNSSSTHALVMMNDDEYRNYLSGDILISRYGDKITKKEYGEKLEKEKNDLKTRYINFWNQEGSPMYPWMHEQYENFEDFWKEQVENNEFFNFDTIFDYDKECMEVIHDSYITKGNKIHALSIIGYED